MKRKLLEIGHEREKIVIKEELQEFEDNLLYINNYPYGYKYISLYPKDKNEVYIKKHKEMFDFIFKNVEYIYIYIYICVRSKRPRIQINKF